MELGKGTQRPAVNQPGETGPQTHSRLTRHPSTRTSQPPAGAKFLISPVTVGPWGTRPAAHGPRRWPAFPAPTNPTAPPLLSPVPSRQPRGKGQARSRRDRRGLSATCAQQSEQQTPRRSCRKRRLGPSGPAGGGEGLDPGVCWHWWVQEGPLLSAEFQGRESPGTHAGRGPTGAGGPRLRKREDQATSVHFRPSVLQGVGGPRPVSEAAGTQVCTLRQPTVHDSGQNVTTGGKDRTPKPGFADDPQQSLGSPGKRGRAGLCGLSPQHSCRLRPAAEGPLGLVRRRDALPPVLTHGNKGKEPGSPVRASSSSLQGHLGGPGRAGGAGLASGRVQVCGELRLASAPPAGPPPPRLAVRPLCPYALPCSRGPLVPRPPLPHLASTPTPHCPSLSPPPGLSLSEGTSQFLLPSRHP